MKYLLHSEIQGRPRIQTYKRTRKVNIHSANKEEFLSQKWYTTSAGEIFVACFSASLEESAYKQGSN